MGLGKGVLDLLELLRVLLERFLQIVFLGLQLSDDLLFVCQSLLVQVFQAGHLLLELQAGAGFLLQGVIKLFVGEDRLNS